MPSANEANKRYFQEAYRTGVHGWAVDEPSPYAVDFLDWLKGVVPGGKLLDIGCGEGRHSLAAAQRGFRVTAIDFEPLALDRARRFAEEKGMRGITFKTADALVLPFPDAYFDIVLDYGCLHHQRKSDWLVYKAGVLRTLKPQGFYVLSVFSPRFRLFRGSRRKWHIASGAYRRCFSRKDLRDLFHTEFEIIRMNEQCGRGGGFRHLLMQKRG